MHPTFWTLRYKGGFIHGKLEGNKETVTYQAGLYARAKEAKSVHAAKCAITRALNMRPERALNMPIEDDKRYTVTLEWCGYPERRHVARFCGKWIGQSHCRNDAVQLCISHNNTRMERANG